MDIIILTEINIKKEELSFYQIPGYNTYIRTREITRGGGILIYAKENLSFNAQRVETEALEMLHGQLITGKTKTHLVAIYRPPQKSKILFIEQLENIVRSFPVSENVIVIGDTNIDILNDVLNPTAKKYKNTLCGCGLQCVIPSAEVTRAAIVNGQLQSSCLDHVWVRAGRSEYGSSSFVLETHISDHHAVGLALATSVNNNMCSKVISGSKTREMISDKLVKQKLVAYDWTQLLGMSCPLILFQKLCEVFSQIYKDSTVTVTNHNKRITQPWIDKYLYNMLCRRDNLFRIWKASPKNMNKRLEYTKFRNKVNKIVNEARNRYKQAEIKKCEGNFRKIWENINSWLGRNKSSLDDVILRHLGKTGSIPEICTNFAKTFTEEIKGIKHVCNIKFFDRKTYVTPSEVSFRYSPVIPSDIEKVINTLSSEKAPGLDGVRVKDIKYLRKQLSPILAKFINMCLTGGLYPDELKIAFIRPIYKSGSHIEYVNYRPIAILSVIDKIVEKVIVSQINKFLESHNILSDTQYGFRRGRSTVSALTAFSDYVNECLDSGKQLIALFIDYKKAFDTLDHDTLLQAMDECGIRGPTKNWFQNYLYKRKIRTFIAGVTGEEASVDLGVPTGSVFGPVGYIMHVNSVSNVVNGCRVFMYADDMCVVHASRDISEVQRYIQEDFEQITKWAHDNGIILNLSKTKCMHVYSPHNLRAKTVHKRDLDIMGHTYECLHRDKFNCVCVKLEYVNTFKYLGLNIDSNFNWKTHVTDICNKLRSVLGKFYQLHNVVNKQTLLIVYYALADSLISYGLIVYGRTFKTYLQDIKKVQTRIIKFLVSKKVKKKCNKEYEKLFSICKILPVDMKVDYVLSLEHYFSDKFKVSIENKFNTRSVREKRLVQPKATNYYGERTSRYLVPKLFNKIDMLRHSPKLSKGLLRSRLRNLLLGNEDSAVTEK